MYLGSYIKPKDESFKKPKIEKVQRNPNMQIKNINFNELKNRRSFKKQKKKKKSSDKLKETKNEKGSKNTKKCKRVKEIRNGKGFKKTKKLEELYRDKIPNIT